MIGWYFVALALLVAAGVAVLAARRPILFRMAARNAFRRPKQTLTVIAGLMIGTAIISAALVAGQSATSAIRGAVYDALGEIDESVSIQGFHFFPEDVAGEFDDPAFDGVAPNIIWSVTTEAPRTDLFEPGVSLIGFDPAVDGAFGDFESRSGPLDDRLAPDEVLVNDELAEALDLQAGDTLTIRYTPPVDPLLPTYEFYGGLIGPALDPNLLLELGIEPAPVTDSHFFTVPQGSTQLTVLLFCGGTGDCPDGTVLRVTAIAPDGTSQAVAHETPSLCGQSLCPTTPNPLWLNVTGAIDDGVWELQVTGQVSTQTPYAMAAVALEPVYDVEELAERGRALEELDTSQLEDFLDLDLFGTPQEADLIVAGITNGGRGHQFDLGPTAFVDLDTAQSLLSRDGQVNYIKFSNPGGQAAGAAGTARAMVVLEDRIEAIQETYPDASVQHLEAKSLKQDFLQVADDAGELMTSLMIFAGSLSIITGLLLIINIFTMLAEERRSELGMARAVGLSQSDLVRLFVFEGSLYAVLAAFVGSLLGLALAFGMIVGLNTLIANQGGGFPPIPFAPSPSAVPIAFATGALLTFATIFVASRRQSRLNIVRAIRQIEDPEKSGKKWMVFTGIPVLVMGAVVTALGWIFWQFSMQVFGPLLVAIGLMLGLRPYMRRKRLDTLVAGSLALYYAMTIFVINKFDDVTEANLVGPVRGVVMTLCLVVLVSYWNAGPKLLGRLLSKAKRLRAIAAPAVAYPQHKRFRTGMTLAMFSIVILSIGFFSIFGALFEVDPARHTGGFDVEATTTLRVEDLDAYDRGLLAAGVIESRDAVDVHTTGLPDFITVNGERTGHFGPPQHNIYGVDEAWIEHQEFQLLWTLDDISDADAYAAMMAGEGVIVGYTYSTNERGQDLSHEVGETLTIHLGDCHDPVEPRKPGAPADCPHYTILGIQEQYHFPGIWLPKEEVNGMFPGSDQLYLFKLATGTDAGDTAKELERNYRDVGMDATASQEQVQEEQETFRQILGAMKVFLGLGLVVGVLSLGIITSRSVLERRQEIGMLRALGYTGRMIRRIFFIEVTLIILMGALIGLVCSIIVTAGLWVAIIRELNYPYVIPWAEIGWLLLVSYLVALLATAAPILRAAKVAPAEALRYIE